MKEKRWAQIAVCQHEWSDYFDEGQCANEYCTWIEQRCKKCGVYSRTCRCGFECGLSGEPMKRERKRQRKREQELLRQAAERYADLKKKGCAVTTNQRKPTPNEP